jgi:hypothetical protein
MTSADRVDGTSTTLRRRTLLAAAVAAVGLAGAASAWADTDLVDLKVVDRETGQALRTWRHHGRLFVAGEPGARYGLRVTNHTDGRVLLVMSVDGVNVVTGETANYGQNGYVLDAHDSYDVTGWRKSNVEVAAFAFAPLPQSYAARTGRPGDVGVIGMAVFRERVVAPVPYSPLSPIRPEWRDESSRDSSSAARRAAMAPRLAAPAPPPMNMAPMERPKAPAPSMPQATERSAGAFYRPQDEKLGTAHGAREWSVVNTTTFVRATRYPQSIREVEYDTYDNLVASGVIPPSPYAEHRPRPFPASPGGFVPDPPPEP